MGMISRRFLVVSLSILIATACFAFSPVQFEFCLTATNRNPFARDVWAEVKTPSGKVLRLPVYYYGDNRFAVRTRSVESGEYHLGIVTEKNGEDETKLTVMMASPLKVRVQKPQTRLQVSLDPSDHTRFILGSSAAVYSPLGANVAWANGNPAKYYNQVFSQFAAEGLNWIRIWMAHWGGLNLDWRANGTGNSLPLGQLDLRVAADWDKIISNAEHSGVYVQLVLQHHGQYSSGVNPNWAENPWNAANPGGFLKEPKDFFISAQALELTKLKYRYIVARWGYSPAILAWELFNEVHWVDPINREQNESIVAQWHSQMAEYLRSVDHYDHLVTTSTEDLRSPIYAKMDYFQPHLYAYSLLTGPLSFHTPLSQLAHPVFYGEAGDDHAPLNDEQKNSGIAIVPPVWASLMGPARYPAQPWLGDKIIQTNRLTELGAVARFLKASGLSNRQGLQPYSPQVECAEQVPFVIEASQVWQQRPSPEFTLPLDGRLPVELGDIPRAFSNPKKGEPERYPSRAIYHIEFPKDTKLQARVTGSGGKGANIRISVSGKTAVEKSWTAGSIDAPSWDHPVELAFTAPAGSHTLVVENPGGADWFQLDMITTDLVVPVIAVLGKRSDNFMALWVWHRTGIFALQAPAPVSGALLLDDVPAGKWTVTWWDTFKGVPAPAQEIDHGGGMLRLPVPALNRHSAVVLTR